MFRDTATPHPICEHVLCRACVTGWFQYHTCCPYCLEPADGHYYPNGNAVEWSNAGTYLCAPREFVRTEAALYLTGGSTAVDAARREGPTDGLESKRAAHKGSGKGDNEVAAPNWTQPDEVDLLCYEKLSDDSDGEEEDVSSPRPPRQRNGPRNREPTSPKQPPATPPSTPTSSQRTNACGTWGCQLQDGHRGLHEVNVGKRKRARRCPNTSHVFCRGRRIHLSFPLLD